MVKYIVKRILGAIVTLFLIATATFFIMKLIPGGPFTSERILPPEIEATLMEKYNLNAPLHQQYFDYMTDLLKLDFGVSFKLRGVQVIDIIKESFPVSAKIGLLSSLVVIIIGIPLGMTAALHKNSWRDYLVSIITTIGVTIPSFVLGTFIVYIFSEKLGWIPAGGLTTIRSYIGPIAALAGFSTAFVTRLTRSSMLEVTTQDYIRTAKANGLSETSIIFKHCLKNALIPVVTYIGPMLATIVTGSFVIEKIFVIPGIGKYFVESITNRDYTVIMGITLFFAIIYVVIILLVDIVYAMLDPRIQLVS